MKPMAYRIGVLSSFESRDIVAIQKKSLIPGGHRDGYRGGH